MVRFKQISQTHMVTFFRTLFLLVVLFSTANAQSDPSVIAFRTMGWGFELGELYYYKQGAYEPVKVEESTISGFYELHDSQNLTLFSKSYDAETKQPIYEQIREVLLPAEADQSLVVFFGSAENPELFRAIGYDDSISNIGNKDVLIANFSLVPLAFQVGKSERFGLKPTTSKVVRGEASRHVYIQLAAFRKNSWEAEFSTELRVREGNRYMLFFRDLEDPELGLSGMSPTLISENIQIIQAALKNPNPEIATGHLPEGVEAFIYIEAEPDTMPGSLTD